MTKTLELPVGELKQALAGLAKVINGKATLPILGHVRVEPDGNDAVCLHGTDLDAFATCRIPARNLGNFPACTVAFEPLAKLVKSSKGDLALLREEDGRVSVRYPIGDSLARTPIESLAVTEWPPLPNVTAPANPLSDTFKPALKQALECAGKDSSRYVLNGACLDVSRNDCHTVVATDGHHLFAANTFSFKLPQSVIVPERKFLNWSGFAEDGPWQLAVELDKNKQSEWIKLQSNRWTFITRAIEGVYPNWRQVVLAGEGKTKLVFSPAAVETILDALPCLPTWSDLNIPVVLEFNANEFCLKSHAKDNEDWTRVPVSGVRVTGVPFEITLNRTLLSKALRFGFTECDVYSEYEPVQFNAPGRKLVVMPLRFNEAPQTVTTPNTPQPEAAESGAPSAGQPNQPVTEERKTMPAKSDKKPDSPLKEAAEQIEKIKETLKAALNDCSAVLTAIKAAEKDAKATEKEVEGVRTTLRSLQKVQI